MEETSFAGEIISVFTFLMFKNDVQEFILRHYVISFTTFKTSSKLHVIENSFHLNNIRSKITG